MKFALFILAFVLGFQLQAQTSHIQNQGLDGKNITVNGYIIDEPRFHSFEGGKYQSYTFKVAPKAEKVHGDEYIMVTFKTVSWGKTVGSFNFRKGNFVTLTGEYFETRNKGKSNLAGSMTVNKKTYREVAGK